jgi:hypothetical protein
VRWRAPAYNAPSSIGQNKGSQMYIGGGTLVVILIIVLIVVLLRRR